MNDKLIPHAVATRGTVGEVIEAGAIAGILGGVAMLAVGMTYSGVAGHGAWAPLRAIAATMVGSSAAAAMTPLAVALAGLIAHFVVSVAFGVIFAALMPPWVPAAPAFVLAEFAGLSILVLMSLVVLPLINPVVRSHLMWGATSAVPVSVAFAMHLAYGAGLSLSPWLRRRLGSRSLALSSRLTPFS